MPRISNEYGTKYAPGRNCILLGVVKGGHTHVCAHCGTSCLVACENHGEFPLKCGNCYNTAYWLDPREDNGLVAQPAILPNVTAEVKFMHPQLGRQMDLSPQEALEMAAEFCERNKMWPQPNARGYFDDGKISTTEKTTVVLRVAMFILMGVDPNRIKDEQFNFPPFQMRTES